MKRARRIIAWRLGRLAVEYSDAVSHLISDAKIENAAYLLRAVQQQGALRAEHADATPLL